MLFNSSLTFILKCENRHNSDITSVTISEYYCGFKNAGRYIILSLVRILNEDAEFRSSSI